MALEDAVIVLVALALPIWLVVEQVLVLRRSTKERRAQMASAAREKSVSRPGARLSRRPQRAA